jgi:GTP-binding protein
MIENYIRKRENLVHLFVLIDSRHSPQKIDLDFINKLGEWRKSFALVFTKADKNKPQATKRNVNSLCKLWSKAGQTTPFFVSSALTKEGRNENIELYNISINQ